MPPQQSIYLAYMLRLWQAGQSENGPVWRAAIESPHTGERRVFAGLPELFAFLLEKSEQKGTDLHLNNKE
ncbi:MAG: hypothetical protein JXM69_14490 [Anaerolineae bacterium]|nr:hypothetical protein [Anaerolineae bacterium]